MGGKAFSQNLPPGSFPRMPPPTYHHLKTRYTSRLQSLYDLVQVPHEAPEKLDHGDLDFIVASPRNGLAHEDVKHALSATMSLPMEGNRTSHFAVPAEEEGKYVQIDVHVCADVDEFHRIVFFHSYGDMGMILGRVAKSVGLGLSTNGLKISNKRPDECHPPTLHLSDCFEDILPFFGLSMARWEQGFTSRQSIFEWVASCSFFAPQRLSKSSDMEAPNTKERKLQGREMYRAFCVYVDERLALENSESSSMTPKSRATNRDIICDALQYFGKTEEYDRIVHVNWVKMRIKAMFTGNHVMEWTGESGLRVREIMQVVRRRLGGEENIAHLEVDEIKSVVLQVHKEI